MAEKYETVKAFYEDLTRKNVKWIQNKGEGFVDLEFIGYSALAGVLFVTMATCF